MKKSFIAIALFIAAGTAFANGSNTGHSNGNGHDNSAQGGTATAGASAAASAQATGVGIGSATAGVNSTVRNDNTNEQGQMQGQQQQAVSNSGGNRLTNEGNNAAQRTNVVVQGDVTESNTPPVVAGVLPSVPTSCRLYLFGGGSTRDGAGSGTFPIGNDQTCLSIATLNLMERAGGFTQVEKQKIVCKVEGMAEFDTCKAAAK